MYGWCLDTYVEAGGTTGSEWFHRWTGMSLLGAALSDQILIPTGHIKPLRPNLYVALIAPSGIGKGRTIDGLKLVLRHVPSLQARIGPDRSTTQATLDLMAGEGTNRQGRRVGREPMAKPYFIHPELIDNLGGNKERAIEVIRNMTSLYDNHETYTDSTRTHGVVTIHSPCINWLCGSTREWFLEVVPPNTIISGFLARVVVVVDERKFSQRPKRGGKSHPDALRMYAQIAAHIEEMIATCKGEMLCDNGALDLIEHYDDIYEEPDDEYLAPTYRREHERLYKFAAIFAAADLSMTIRREHVDRAHRLVQNAYENLPYIVKNMLLSNHIQSGDLRLVETYIKTKGSVLRREVVQFMANKSIHADKVDKCLKTLLAANKVTLEIEGKASRFTWADTRKRIY